MIKKRPSREEALAERAAFSNKNLEVHGLVKGARDHLRDRGLKHGPKEVRAEAQCSMGNIVFHLRLLNAIED